MLCRDSSLAKGDAFLALFAINSPESWEDVKRLREKIVRINEGDERIPILFIASKSVSRQAGVHLYKTNNESTSFPYVLGLVDTEWYD